MTDELALYAIPKEELPTVWGKVGPIIKEVIPYTGGRHSEKTVIDFLLQDRYQLWIVMQGEDLKTAFTTEVFEYPTGMKVCEIILLGGKQSREWLEYAIEQIGLYAEQNGCEKLQMVGREGWTKLLKSWGKVSVMMDIPISHIALRR